MCVTVIIMQISVLILERLSVATFPMDEVNPVGTVPKDKMHPIGTLIFLIYLYELEFE